MFYASMTQPFPQDAEKGLKQPLYKNETDVLFFTSDNKYYPVLSLCS
jgi:hypothetical protein